MLAVRAPVAEGVNVTLTAQVALIARLPPQVFADMEKLAAFVPAKVIEEIVSVAEPLFVTVVVSAELVTVTAVFGKESEVGLKLIADTPPAPVPPILKHCGEAGALSVTQTWEARAPAACGVNVTLTVQVPDAATVPQLFVCEKLVAFPLVT